MADINGILDLIDNTLEDSLSPDAMRYSPNPSVVDEFAERRQIYLNVRINDRITVQIYPLTAHRLLISRSVT